MATKGSRAHRHFAADGRLGFRQALDLAKTWLTPTIRPTAIIAETEEVALAILDVAREIGLVVPRDLSLIALEERASLERATPPISTLFQPYGDLFRAACERLIDRVQRNPANAEPAKALEPQRPFTLIKRESVTKAPRAV